MKLIVLPILIVTLFSCATRKMEDVSGPVEEVVVMKDVEAKVIIIPFENKAGKRIDGVGDYFLVYEGIEWFVKFSGSAINPDQLQPLVNQTAKFLVEEKEGLWDTDDPNVQSRIGKYVYVHKIVQN